MESHQLNINAHRIHGLVGLVLCGLVFSSCDNNRNDKNATYVEPQRTDLFAPKLFIEQPNLEQIGRNSVSFSFASNESANVVITIQPGKVEDAKLALTVDDLFALEKSATVLTIKTWAKVRKTANFSDLKQNTNYVIFFAAEDEKGNRQNAPQKLGFTTLGDDQVITFSNKPIDGYQGRIWSFKPLTRPAIGALRLKSGPSWLTWDRITQTISGIPDNDAYRNRSFSFTLTADQNGFAGDHVFDVKVHGDPLFEYSWHLENTGQNAFAWDSGIAGFDINVAPAINEGWTGGGKNPIKVLVADTGLQKDHPDLVANFSEENSRNFITGSQDPSPALNPKGDGDHGTSVAGIIAAQGWNDIGSRGIAPEVKISGANVLDAQSMPVPPVGDDIDSWKKYQDFMQTYRERAEANFREILVPDNFNVDIINQSYGIPPENYVGANAPGAMAPEYRMALKEAVTSGRSNLGTIIIKSAGNSGRKNQDANFDPTNVSPYQMIIGAINALGKKSSYSSPGANLWVSAPGGEGGFESDYGAMDEKFQSSFDRSLFSPAIVTTDIEAADEKDLPKKAKCQTGYSKTIDFFDATLGDMGKDVASQLFGMGESSGFNIGRNVLNNECFYTATFNGTSSAAPMVSGVVALMLQKNPKLTWRDVKHVLATTSRQIDATNVGRIAVVAPDSGDDGKIDPEKPFNTFTTLLPWQINSAGYHFHNWYGFGLIDASAALKMVDPKTYKNLPPPLETPIEVGANISSMKIIQNNSFPEQTPVFDISVENYDKVVVEAVELVVSVTLPGSDPDPQKRTDMSRIGFELISPSGTRSILLPVQNGGYFYAYVDKEFISNAFYGEKAAGAWALRVTDGKSDKKRYKEKVPNSNPVQYKEVLIKLPPAELSNAKLIIYGHEYAK